MQKPHYTIRDATETDVPAILNIHAQSWLDTYPNEQAGISRKWVEERIDGWFTEGSIEKRRERARESQHNKDMLYKVAEIIAWADPTRTLELEIATYNERAKVFCRKYDLKEIENSEHIAAGKIPVITMIRKGDQQ